MMWFRADDSNNTNGTLFVKHRGSAELVDEAITWQVNKSSGNLELRLNDVGYSCDIPLTFASWHIAAFYLKEVNSDTDTDIGCFAKKILALQSAGTV